MISKIYKISFIIFCFSTIIFPQNKEIPDSLLQNGINQIYNLQFEEARTTFNNIKLEFPNHPAGYFFDAMIDWWKIMIDFDNEELDEIFINKIDFIIDFCDDLLDKNPDYVDALFFKGGALGFRAKLSVFRQSWVDAAMDGKDALPLVNEAFEIDSTNNDILFGFGIYNYYVDVIPQKNPWVEPFLIFFPKGDKTLGLQQLIETSQNGKYAKIEARYFLMTLYYFFEENFNEALKYAEGLTNDFPNNPEFQKYLGRIWVKMGNYQKAIFVYDDILEKVKSNKRGYSTYLEREAYYYKGNNSWNLGELDKALKYFSEVEKLSYKISDEPKGGFIVNAILYQGMILDLKNKRADALKKYNILFDFDEYKNSHERAEKYLSQPYKK